MMSEDPNRDHVHPKIISGGQTGADRTALDWAIANNIARLIRDGVSME
jgi:hypothetical protein